MTGDAFAQDWPGRRAWAQRSGPSGPRGKRRHDWRQGPPDWLFQGRGRDRPPIPRHRPPTPEEIQELMEWRRMRGGPFGFGGPGGPRGRGRGRGRARRGDVRLALLRLLAEQPSNGYQLMQTIEERSQGRWSPSPGSVYPTLAQLEDEGLIRSRTDDGSRLYEITTAGREHLETRAQEPDPWQPAPEEGGDALLELGPLVIQIGKAVWQVASVGDAGQRARAIELLNETRRSLYRILAEDHEAPGADTDDALDEDDEVEGPAGPGDPGV